MNSTLRSVGKICPVLVRGWFMVAVVAGLPGCRSGTRSDDSAVAPSQVVREELAGEISLKADRSRLAELRQEVPAAKQSINDEQAVILQLMTEIKLTPSELQSRYQQLVHKRRSVFRDKVKRLREEFNAEERRRKEQFLVEQKRARDEFRDRAKGGRADRWATREFFADQDRRRQEFFAGERDRRTDFESEMLTQSKDFDAYMRERQKEFSEQLRLYTKRFYDAKKEKSVSGAKPADGAAAASPDEVNNAVLKEFEEMKAKPGTPLEAGKTGP